MNALTADKVEKTLLDCLFRDDEPMLPRIEVQGIVNNFGFHPGRVEEHYATIVEMLDCLPETFHQGGGGGWSFLNACMDKDGNQWTGLHRTMDHLFQLGAAAGRVKCPFPREHWASLPGSVPYYMVTTERFPVEITTEEKYR